MNRLVCLIVLLTATQSLRSQDFQVYDAHLSRLQKSIAAWRAQVDQIDAVQIEVPYHIGKLIDDNKKVLLQNLDLASLYATNIPSKRTLSAEIDLLGLLKEVHSNMDSLSDILLEMVSGDQKKAQTWGLQLGAIMNGPLNDEEVYQIKAVDEFADDLERRCVNYGHGKNCCAETG